MNSSSQLINIFLHFGYLPYRNADVPDSLRNWLNGELPKLDFNFLDKRHITEIGIKKLKKAFKEEIGEDFNKTHVVPLSGGLDSRAVLVNLLEIISRSKIITVTFGVKGTPEYEFARMLAKKTGVKWEGIDLSPQNWKWDTEDLVSTAKKSRFPNRVFDTLINYEIPKRFGDDCVYWSGFMGDPVSGSHMYGNKNDTWNSAKLKFSDKNCRAQHFKLTPKEFDPVKVLPTNAYADKKILSYYEQLDFNIRQLCFIKNTISDVFYDYKYPFINSKWLQYMLSLDSSLRVNKNLYREILSHNWQAFFENEMDTHLNGYRRRFINNVRRKFNKRIASNYIDWNYALRHQIDFKEVVFSNLQDLKNRKNIDWFDIDNLWCRHQNRKGNLANEILTVAALEINIKAGAFERWEIKKN